MGGRDKHGTYQARPDSQQDEENSAPTHQTFRVYIEALTSFRRAASPSGLNNAALSPSRVLENGSSRGDRGRNKHWPEEGKGAEPSTAPGWLAWQSEVTSSG